MKRKKILIIDNDRSLVQTISFQLSNSGLEVESAEDGVSGLAKIRSWQPDLLMLELILLRKNGFEVLGELKSASFPIVVYSRLDSADDFKEAKALGAWECFSKKEVTLKILIEKIIALAK